MARWISTVAIACAAVLLVCGVFVGCGGPGNVARVSGKVTLDGQPLTGARVNFTPTGTGSPSNAITDGSGNYNLVYTREVMGAEIGEHAVSITTYQSGDPDAEPPKPKVAEKVPAKYNSATELKETVKAGANTFDFELQSGGKIVEPTPEKSTAGPGRPR